MGGRSWCDGCGSDAECEKDCPLRQMPPTPPPPSEQEISRFVREVCRRCGIHVETFRDGSNGLINVPAKYVAVIDALHIALISLTSGEGLPEFAPEEPKAKRVEKEPR